MRTALVWLFFIKVHQLNEQNITRLHHVPYPITAWQGAENGTHLKFTPVKNDCSLQIIKSSFYPSWMFLSSSFKAEQYHTIKMAHSVTGHLLIIRPPLVCRFTPCMDNIPSYLWIFCLWAICKFAPGYIRCKMECVVKQSAVAIFQPKYQHLLGQ